MKLFLLLLSFFICTQTPLYAAQVKAHPKDTVEKSVTEININTADAKELMQLKGIGEKRAQNILEYRKNQAMFASAADLAKVKGFSEKKVEKIMTDNPDKKIVVKTEV